MMFPTGNRIFRAPGAFGAVVAACALALAALSGCMGENRRGGGSYIVPNPIIGPRFDPPLPSSPDPTPPVVTYEEVKLDVVIPVFDPGLHDDHVEEGVWPELRRAEAVRFALMLQDALRSTRAFGDVYVSTDADATGDLYLLGAITKSNGEDIGIRINAVDAAGNRWMRKDYSHRVKENFWKNAGNRSRDPYRPVFNQAARDVAALVKKRAVEDLATLRDITELRFAREFAEDAFAGYIYEQGGRYSLLGLPARDDPMLERTRAIRMQEGLFMDRLQNHYAAFAQRTDSSYFTWQEHSLIEAKAKRQKKSGSVFQGVLGAALALGGAYTAAKGTSSGNTGAQVLGVGASVAGGLLVAQSFRNSTVGKAHAANLSELGQSLDMEAKPQVMELENTTVRLTGSAREQFRQWRAFLKQFYALEKIPNKTL